jgi:hypothetical protein
VIFPSDRPPRTTQICVFLADLSDPILDPTDLCARRTLCTDCFLRIFYVRSSHTGEDLNNFHFLVCGLPTTNRRSKMVVPDYHEEDAHSTASSSTQLPSQHPLRQRFRERLSGGTDLSTVPPTPLNHRHHHLSPVRTETPSHGYTLRATPERIEREGSQGDGFGRAVAGRDGGVAGAVAGGDVTGSGGGRVGGRGVVGGAVTARIVGGTVGRAVGARISRGGIGRAVAGGGGRVPGGGRTRQSTGAAAGGTAWGGVKNYSAAEVDSLLRYLDEAPRNFLKKNFYAATLPPTLPERQSNLTHTAGSMGQPPVLVICIPRPMHVP